ncbi:hypothetical protein AVEN_200981-1 [Araneus ventricosus]|uniref:Uncharacterized protein n=1 Tax=Araneus ventricosus TaxID=182803 RepID=A0A4Y2V5T3_ARAVE|nr:hypothetical protein AVEN_200981-1 [Araneus ventricosus]
MFRQCRHLLTETSPRTRTASSTNAVIVSVLQTEYLSRSGNLCLSSELWLLYFMKCPRISDRNGISMFMTVVNAYCTPTGFTIKFLTNKLGSLTQWSNRTVA